MSCHISIASRRSHGFKTYQCMCKLPIKKLHLEEKEKTSTLIYPYLHACLTYEWLIWSKLPINHYLLDIKYEFWSFVLPDCQKLQN